MTTTPDASFGTSNYREQGGAKEVITGTIAFPTGGRLEQDTGSVWTRGGTTVTATGAELNMLAGVTAGTASPGKAVVPTTANVIDKLDITTLLVAGVTTSALGSDYVTGLTPGTTAAGLAMVPTTDGLMSLINGTVLQKASVTIDATAAELNKLASVTGGTTAASKALVVDANKRLDTLDITTPLVGGVTLTATGTEINLLDGVASSLAQVTVIPATGSCAVQLALKDANGATISHAESGIYYLSTSNGLGSAPVSSCAALTNGMVVDLVAGTAGIFTTKADGTLGFTLTATAATNYYLSLVTTAGRLMTTSALAIN